MGASCLEGNGAFGVLQERMLLSVLKPTSNMPACSFQEEPVWMVSEHLILEISDMMTLVETWTSCIVLLSLYRKH